MTAKSRRRKLEHKLRTTTPKKTFYFPQGLWDVAVRAETEEQAKQIFQDQYGYQPESNA